jgi:hypothetical protein
MSHLDSMRGILLTASTGALLGCGGLSAGGMPAEATPPASSSAPIIDRALNRTFPTNQGLLTNLGEHGWPVTEGNAVDPAILETQRFYGVLSSRLPVPRTADGPQYMAPMALEEWKHTYRFPPRDAGEPLDTYRRRTGMVIYYNENELGLGRELGCSEFPDGMDAAGNALTGVACYVTNYGNAFRDRHGSLRLAAEGTHPKNTVCITYRSSMEPGYEVQFYVYGPSGNRQDWAQLDTLGPRAHPQVCMNCHGGGYDDQAHLAKFARFLPLDPNRVLFAEDGGPPGEPTRSDQEERIRRINALALRTPLTPAQREMLEQLYGGSPLEPGTSSRPAWQPAAWRDTVDHRDLFDRVVKPYCSTCHLAGQKRADGSEVFTYGLFETPAGFQLLPLAAVVCGSFGMPNAQTTSIGFWDTSGGPISIGARQYPAAADALLAFSGRDRSSCDSLAVMSSCARGPDPDMVCGNAFSGTACDRQTGRCVPDEGLIAPRQPAMLAGVCRTDGSRRCPYPLECRRTEQALAGLPGFDGACVPCGDAGLSACTLAAPCVAGLQVVAGVCQRS